MIERKQKHFGAYDRMIVDFELVEQGDNYHITVASIIPDKDT
jgi:predicted nuclease with TOPRIM domain